MEKWNIYLPNMAEDPDLFVSHQNKILATTDINNWAERKMKGGREGCGRERCGKRGKEFSGKTGLLGKPKNLKWS